MVYVIDPAWDHNKQIAAVFRGAISTIPQSTTPSSRHYGAGKQPTTTIKTSTLGISHQAIFHPSPFCCFFHPTHATSYLRQQCKHPHQQTKDAIVTNASSSSQEICIWWSSACPCNYSGKVDYGRCCIRRLENFSEKAHFGRIRAETKSTCVKAGNIFGCIH